MSKENDDFIEELLKGLPKVEPMSEFEIKKFEKLIDKQTGLYAKSKAKSSFRMPASIAASIAIAFGAAFLLTNNSSVVNTKGEISSSQSTPTKSGESQNQSLAPTTTTGSGSKPVNEGSNNSTGVYANSGESNANDGKVPVYESNLDYENQLVQIKKIVKLASAPENLTSLTYAAQQCSIKQGISESILAFDKGTFQGQRVSAYFSGSSKSDYKIILVDSSCELIEQP